MRSALSRRRFLRFGAATVAGICAAGTVRGERRAPSPSLVFDIRRFGATGDPRGDDTQAFIALHKRIMATLAEGPLRPVVITIPPGHYRYRWNAWLFNIPEVEVRGASSTLQCISDSPWDSEKASLVTNLDFFSTRLPHGSQESARITYGSRIDSAARGERTVRLLPGEGPLPVAPGGAVCVYSHDQQFEGYPPNPRYFDIARAVSVSDTAVTLDRALEHDHRRDGLAVPRSDTSFGGARIVALDRPGAVFCRTMRLQGLTFVPNPHAESSAGNTLLVSGVDDFRMHDCHVLTGVFTMSRACVATDCTFDLVEPDKLVEDLTMERCRIGRMTQATGVEQVTLRGCSIRGGSDLQARTIVLEDCILGQDLADVAVAALSLEGFAPTRHLALTRCTFTAPRGHRAAPVSDNAVIWTDLGPPFMLEPTALSLPVDDARATRLHGWLDAGAMLLFGRMRHGVPYCDGRTAILKALRLDGGLLRLELDRPVRARQDDILFSHRVHRITARNNRFLNGGPEAAPLSPRTTWQDSVEDSRLWRWRITGRPEAPRLLRCPGRPRRISVEMRHGHSGVTAARLVPLTAAATITVPLDAAGLRTRSVEAPYGWDYRLVHDCRAGECPPVDYVLEVETGGLSG